jgi:hypothetical protein
MVIARSEIRAVRWVVKQLPVEMLQQCSSTSSCMRTRIVIKSITPAASFHSFLNSPTQFSLCFAIHF